MKATKWKAYMQRNHEQYNYAAFASTNTLPLAAGSATVEATPVPYKSVHFSPFANWQCHNLACVCRVDDSETSCVAATPHSGELIFAWLHLYG